MQIPDFFEKEPLTRIAAEVGLRLNKRPSELLGLGLARGLSRARAVEGLLIDYQILSEYFAEQEEEKKPKSVGQEIRDKWRKMGVYV